MKVAAYQAPLPAEGPSDALERIRGKVQLCEANGVSLLCCPEAILGGLADHAEEPSAFAIRVDDLESVSRSIASETVTTIVGFSEVDDRGRLFNSAALFHRGAVQGVYRKLYPAINKSVYEPGESIPTFQVGELRLGIVICNDSNISSLRDSWRRKVQPHSLCRRTTRCFPRKPARNSCRSRAKSISPEPSITACG